MTKYVKCQYKERKREISAITMRKYCKIMLYLYCHLIRTAINALKRSLQLNSKNGSGIHSRFALEMRQRPTLPYSVPYSTIGSVQLNFRVRYENGWILHDIVTAVAYCISCAPLTLPLRVALRSPPHLQRTFRRLRAKFPSTPYGCLRGRRLRRTNFTRILSENYIASAASRCCLCPATALRASNKISYIDNYIESLS